MQYTIISPSQFKTSLWKSGKGKTVELAINEGASLDNFDWRISMADVTEDGVFSDFSQYLRHLVLIEGESITLKHDKKETDFITQRLSFAKFSGSNKTTGILPSGPITDFNIITREDLYEVNIFTSITPTTKRLPACDHAFVYSLTDKIEVTSNSQATISLPPQHLLKIDAVNDSANVKAFAGNLIVACIKTKS